MRLLRSSRPVRIVTRVCLGVVGAVVVLAVAGALLGERAPASSAVPATPATSGAAPAAATPTGPSPVPPPAPVDLAPALAPVPSPAPSLPERELARAQLIADVRGSSTPVPALTDDRVIEVADALVDARIRLGSWSDAKAAANARYHLGERAMENIAVAAVQAHWEQRR